MAKFYFDVLNISESGKVGRWNDLLGLRWRAGGGLTGLEDGKVRKDKRQKEKDKRVRR